MVDVVQGSNPDAPTDTNTTLPLRQATGRLKQPGVGATIAGMATLI